MSDPVHITVAGDPCLRLAPNRLRGARRGYRGGWYDPDGPAKETIKTAAFAGWCAAGRPWFDCKVHLAITIYRGRTLDPDAGLSACKWLLDGLKGRLMPDDSDRWVEYGPIRFVTGRKYAGPNARVEIDVYPAEEALNADR